ncbi:MAG: hypothetical protein V3T43_06190 [Nitrosomonadaceae bacterium]
MAGDYASAAGTGDVITLALDAAIVAYLEGGTYKFKATANNTGATTLNVNSIGAKTIKKYHDQDLEADDIENGMVIVCIYDGTVMQMVNADANRIPSSTKATLDDQLTVTVPAGMAITTAAIQISPALGSQVGGTITLPDGSSVGLNIGCEVPAGAATITSIKVLVQSGGTAGNAVVLFDVFQTTRAAALSNDLDASNQTEAITTAGTSITVSSTAYNAITLVEGAVLSLTMQRIGGDASDTLAANLDVIGVVFEFAA